MEECTKNNTRGNYIICAKLVAILLCFMSAGAASPGVHQEKLENNEQNEVIQQEPHHFRDTNPVDDE